MKHFITLFLIILVSVVIPHPVSSTTPITIEWKDLIPQLPPEKNPLAGLPPEAVEYIEWIIYLRLYLPEKITPKDQEFYDEMTAALPRLKKQGIDVDAMIQDRQHRSSAVNTNLDGSMIELSGYLLPLDLSGTDVKDFLLVPYVGACIHTPPPPPNQIVHAVSAAPTAFDMDNIFKPVSVTGKLEVKSISKELFLIDGSSDIDIGYSLKVQKIEDYNP